MSAPVTKDLVEIVAKALNSADQAAVEGRLHAALDGPIASSSTERALESQASAAQIDELCSIYRGISAASDGWCAEVCSASRPASRVLRDIRAVATTLAGSSRLWCLHVIRTFAEGATARRDVAGTLASLRARDAAHAEVLERFSAVAGAVTFDAPDAVAAALEAAKLRSPDDAWAAVLVGLLTVATAVAAAGTAAAVDALPGCGARIGAALRTAVMAHVREHGRIDAHAFAASRFAGLADDAQLVPAAIVPRGRGTALDAVLGVTSMLGPLLDSALGPRGLGLPQLLRDALSTPGRLPLLLRYRRATTVPCPVTDVFADACGDGSVTVGAAPSMPPSVALAVAAGRDKQRAAVVACRERLDAAVDACAADEAAYGPPLSAAARDLIVVAVAGEAPLAEEPEAAAPSSATEGAATATAATGAAVVPILTGLRGGLQLSWRGSSTPAGQGAPAMDDVASRRAWSACLLVPLRDTVAVALGDKPPASASAGADDTAAHLRAALRQLRVHSWFVRSAHLPSHPAPSVAAGALRVLDEAGALALGAGSAAPAEAGAGSSSSAADAGTAASSPLSVSEVSAGWRDIFGSDGPVTACASGYAPLPGTDFCASCSMPPNRCPSLVRLHTEIEAAAALRLAAVAPSGASDSDGASADAAADKDGAGAAAGGDESPADAAQAALCDALFTLVRCPLPRAAHAAAYLRGHAEALEGEGEGGGNAVLRHVLQCMREAGTIVDAPQPAAWAFGKPRPVRAGLRGALHFAPITVTPAGDTAAAAAGGSGPAGAADAAGASK